MDDSVLWQIDSVLLRWGSWRSQAVSRDPSTRARCWCWICWRWRSGGSISDISNSLTLHRSLHQQLVNINTRLNEVDQCCFWQVDDRLIFLLIINKNISYLCSRWAKARLAEGAELGGGEQAAGTAPRPWRMAASLNTTANRIQLFRENSVMWTVIWIE